MGRVPFCVSKTTLPLCSSGGMVDTAVLEAATERRVSSSLTLSTKKVK